MRDSDSISNDETVETKDDNNCKCLDKTALESKSNDNSTTNEDQVRINNKFSNNTNRQRRRRRQTANKAKSNS